MCYCTAVVVVQLIVDSVIFLSQRQSLERNVEDEALKGQRNSPSNTRSAASLVLNALFSMSKAGKKQKGQSCKILPPPPPCEKWDSLLTHSLTMFTAKHLRSLSDHSTRYMLAWEPRQRTNCWMLNANSDGAFTTVSKVFAVSTTDLLLLPLFQCATFRTATTPSSPPSPPLETIGIGGSGAAAAGAFAAGLLPLLVDAAVVVALISSLCSFLRQGKELLSSLTTSPSASVRSQSMSSWPFARSQTTVIGTFKRNLRPFSGIGCKYL